MEFLATAAFGLEGPVKRELNALGIEAKGENGGVRFEGTLRDAFRANLYLRCADRVLLVMGEGEVHSFEDLFQLVLSVRWEDILPPDAAFPVSGKCARSDLMSVSDCQSITKKAIAERLKRKYKQTWFAENGSKYPIDASVHGNIARLTVDTSGIALNKRGYRTWNGEAPIRETLASGIIRMSPLREDTPIWDPCCGTGTLLIEAAWQRAGRAPGLTREFSMEKWLCVSQKECGLIREEAAANVDLGKIGSICGSDIDPQALELCRRHIKAAGLSGHISVIQKDLKDLKTDTKNIFFLANPPYGERLSDRKNCEKLYREMRLLKDRHENSRMGVICAHSGFERCFGQRAVRKTRLYNGRLECQYYIF